jgi:type IV secretory pathway VirB2 component (pilin)
MSKTEGIAKLFALLAVFAVGLFFLDGALNGDWEVRLLEFGGGFFVVSVFIVYAASVWRNYREKR